MTVNNKIDYTSRERTSDKPATTGGQHNDRAEQVLNRIGVQVIHQDPFMLSNRVSLLSYLVALLKTREGGHAYAAQAMRVQAKNIRPVFLLARTFLVVLITTLLLLARSWK